jgi:hypothetical protein
MQLIPYHITVVCWEDVGVGMFVGVGVLAGIGGHVTSTTGHALDPTLLGLAFKPVM